MWGSLRLAPIMMIMSCTLFRVCVCVCVCLYMYTCIEQKTCVCSYESIKLKCVFVLPTFPSMSVHIESYKKYVHIQLGEVSLMKTFQGLTL